MAVSHKCRFIFIHIPKCAGTSVEKLLMKPAKLELMRTGVMPEYERIQRQFNVTGSTHGLERHLAASEVLSEIGERRFLSYFKFAIVRNPFERLVSFYEFANRLKNPDMDKIQIQLALESSGFERFAWKALREPQMDLFFNQFKYISIDGKLAVDEVLKFERLDREFMQVLPQLGIGNGVWDVWLKKIGQPRFNLPVKNASSNRARDYAGYYSDTKLRDEVSSAVARDMEMFGYSKCF